MPLSIKNAEVESLAREVSRETGETITAAIANSLRERLQRLRGRRRARVLAEDISDILRRVDALPKLDERSADEILGYDDEGLAR